MSGGKIAALLAAASALYAYGRFIEPAQLKTARVNFTLPGRFRDFRTVFFTDTHFGLMYTERNMARLAQAINEQKPDVVLFGGDFIDHIKRDRSRLDFALLASALGTISAPMGKFAVAGNHDYRGGAYRAFENVMHAGGFAVLRNESVPLGNKGLALYGADDMVFSGNSSRAIELPQGCGIVLAHKPGLVNKMRSDGRCVAFCGHSHGGQIWAPPLNDLIMPSEVEGYVKGRYDGVGARGNITLYVSSGVGMTGLPLRFLVPPQIVAADFTSEKTPDDGAAVLK